MPTTAIRRLSGGPICARRSEVPVAAGTVDREYFR
jgi:hypothetical protein